MEVKELKALLDRGETPVVIDVREPHEWNLVHLDIATHIPLRQIQTRHTELDPAAFTVVYCHHGMRSASAVGYLQQCGFSNVHNLEGGIDAWSREIDPGKKRY